MKVTVINKPNNYRFGKIFRRFMRVLVVVQVVLLFIKFDWIMLYVIFLTIGYIFQNKKLEEKNKYIDFLEREILNKI